MVRCTTTMIPIYNPTHGDSKNRKSDRYAQRGTDYSASSSSESSSSESAGAHSTQRPLAFPLATCSTILGCEHVTACVAEILSSCTVSYVHGRRNQSAISLRLV